MILFLLPLFLAGCKRQEAVVNYTTEEFFPPLENCWPCKMYMHAFGAINDAINGALDKVANNSLIILEICLLFWLLFKVGNLVFSIALPDMKKQLAPILTVLFKALIVIIFLTNTQFFYDIFGTMLIQPLGMAFLSLSEQMVMVPQKIGSYFYYSDNLTSMIYDLDAIWNTYFDSLDKGMFGEVPAILLRVIYIIYSTLNNGLGVAFQLFSLRGFVPSVSALLLIVGLYWLILVIPLFLVEAFVKMGMVLILMPLFLVGWVFTFPKDVVKKVAHSLFSGFFDILFNCIYIALFVTMLRTYDEKVLGNSFSNAASLTGANLRTDAMQMGTNFIILLLLSFAMISLSNHVQEFSTHFFEGAEKNNVLAVLKAIKDYTIKAAKYLVSLGKVFTDGLKNLISRSKGDK